MKQQLFEDKELHKNWYPNKNKIIVPNRDKDNERGYHLFIPPPKLKKNKAGGPLYKQGVQEAILHHKDGSIQTYKTKSGKIMPKSIRYTREPASSGRTIDKRAILDQKGYNGIIFKQYVIIKEAFFVYPVPKSYSKEIKVEVAKGNIVLKTSSPDYDNSLKYIQDILQNINPDHKGIKLPLISNDAIIAGIMGTCLKCYGAVPGTYLKLFGL